MLGGQLHFPVGGATVTSTALGVDPAVQGDYELVQGREPAAPDEIVPNDATLRALGRSRRRHACAPPRDTIRSSARSPVERMLRIVGRVRFIYLALDQRAAALPIGTLRAMNGPASAGRASLAMVRLRPGVDVERERAAIAARAAHRHRDLHREALEQVDERLSYFRQLAVILGAVSLVVGFLLVTTLVTVSVNERIGEIAVMRAIGVRRWRIVAQILLESSALMLVARRSGWHSGSRPPAGSTRSSRAFPAFPSASTSSSSSPGRRGPRSASSR